MGKTPQADLELFARCASGFEQVLAQELKGLRLRRVRPLRGGVACFGSLTDAYRACLWSRVATRVQLVLARVPAADAQALYVGVTRVAWEQHVPEGASISVSAHGQNPQLRNTKFTALKVKDALCDRLRDVRGMRPNVDPADPDVAIDVALHQQKATLYLNLSGASLHRRGYREDGVATEAPMKETLAAGMLLAAGWPRIARSGGAFVDPMCGSGTLAIEAALIATNRAPGLLRARWGFEGWAGHDAEAWHAVQEEARNAVADDCPTIVAGDLDAAAVDIARANARRAGVDKFVRLHADDAARLARHVGKRPGELDHGGLLATNPPYGARLLSSAELPLAYAALAASVATLPAGWHVALITPEAGIDAALGRTPEQTLACFNGPIQTWVRCYRTDEPPLTHQITSLAGRQHTVPLAEPHSAQLAARLRKMARERVRWARRAHLCCYRVYDADLPEYAYAIDLFGADDAATDQRYARIEEYRRPGSVDAQSAARRLADAANLTAALFDLPRQNVLALPWQAERKERRWIDVAEGPYRLEVDLVNPAARLPLDQREVRLLAASKADGARVACLFASGVFALVHAAGAGATSTVLVDAAADQLDAAATVMRTNGFAGKQHRTCRQEVRAWLTREARERHRYDLVLCLPPTWLPAKSAGGREWDLQRDHVALLTDAARLLADDGILLFACPGEGVRLDLASLRKAGLRVENKTAAVIPHDFERVRTHPHCLVIRRG